MALSNSQYNAVMRGYEERQRLQRRAMEARVREVYSKIPQIQELDRQLSTRAADCARRVLGGDTRAREHLKEELADLKEQKLTLLKSAGFPADYMEPRYDCPDCQDTGYLPDHSKCHCMKQKIAHYLYEQSGLENLLETENFSHLSTDYYQGEDLTRFKKTVQNARKFVSDFSSHYRNLLFYGTVGTGKSFLSCCIAKELLDAGYCVLYFSACSLFDRISEYTFGSKDRENLAQLYQDLYACDLLIIDDLGTELSNGFVASELFTILNERHLRKRSTIISSNISLEELSEHYSERLFSRITSNYELFKFTGSDIRIQKKLSGRK